MALLVVVFFVYDSHHGERSFKSNLFTVDSAKVTSITIYPKGKGKKEIRLVKTGTNWEVKCDNKSFPADTTALKRILQALSHVKVESVACNDKSCWGEFDISDTLSSHVVVEQDNQVTADFRTGRISVSQSSGMQYNRNRSGDVKSHIRVADDDRVYVVDGFLSMMFGDQVSIYRNKTLFNFNEDLLTKLTFTYPGDSSFTLTKTAGKWMLDDQPADSAEVARFLNAIKNSQNSEFADSLLQFPEAAYKLRIEGNNMPAIEVSGAINHDAKKYYVKSSANTSAIFGSKNAYLFNSLFKSRNSFDIEKVKAKKEKEAQERKQRDEKRRLEQQKAANAKKK
ncbi:MAG: DUF4340 domain-containing protein [Bacteroidales bacterium]